LKNSTIVLVLFLAFTNVYAAKKASKVQVGLPSRMFLIGTIDPDIVRYKLRNELPQFSKCAANLNSPMTMRASFTIEAEGKISKNPLINLVSGNINSKTKKCFQNTLMSIKFISKKSTGKTDVQQLIHIRYR